MVCTLGGFTGQIRTYRRIDSAPTRLMHPIGTETIRQVRSGRSRSAHELRCGATICANYPLLPLLQIQRAAHAAPAAIEHMRVDHRCAHIRMSEQLLHRADIVAVFQ